MSDGIPAGGLLTPLTALAPNVAAGGVLEISPYNALSLEEWREQISYHPFHFWGLGGSLSPVSSACNTLVPQYGYQFADLVGRTEIREAIQKAEENLEPWLGYYPGPRYCQAVLPFPRFPKMDVWRLGYAGADDRWIGLELPDKEVRAIGVETVSPILQNAPITYSDRNADGLYDLFTLTVAAPAIATDLTNVVLYFNATDRFTGDGYEERWRIRPIRVRQSGANLIITGPAWIMVRPVLYETMGMPELDAATVGNYATSVDICYRYPSAANSTLNEGAAILLWETPPYPQVNYNVQFSTTDPAGVAWAIARCCIRDSSQGTIGLGEALYNTTTGVWDAIPWYSSLYKFKPPDRVLVRYLAGFPTAHDGRISHDMGTVITRLAAAELTRRICACDTANRELYQWQFDVARSNGPETFAIMGQEDAQNPFGTRRGQLYAWKFCKGRRVLTGYVP